MTEIVLKTIDCVHGMSQMPAESVDVIVTSPPYNLGIKYRKYNDKQKHDIYRSWTKQWLSAANRVLAPNGSLFLNLGGCPKKPLLPYEIVLLARDTYILQNTFHWIKALSLDLPEGVRSVGHFKPIVSPRFVTDLHEFVFHFTKTGSVRLDRLALGVPYADKSNITRWGHTGGRDCRCRGNIWFIPYPTIRSRNKQRPHPATFPPKLAENAILIHGGNRSDLRVLDPFVGIGNSVIGAREAGIRHFTGFDIDEWYIEDAKRLTA